MPPPGPGVGGQLNAVVPGAATPPTGIGASGAVAPTAPFTPASTILNGFDGVLGLLVAPANVGVENPTLRHFPTQTPARATATAPLPAAPPPPWWFGFQPLVLFRIPTSVLVAVLMPSLLIALGLAGPVRRLVPSALRRPLELGSLPFGAAAAVCVVLLVPKIGGQTVADLTAGPAAASAPQQAVVAQASAPQQNPPASAVWQRLTTIESRVAELQTRLQTTTNIAPPALLDDVVRNSAYTGTGLPATPHDSEQPVAVQLENALQTEYAFFVATVQDPYQRQVLLTGAQAAQPDLRAAVLYDVRAVEAQLAQEAAIQQAEQAGLAGTGAAPTSLLTPLSGAITQAFGATDFALEPAVTVNGATYPHFHTGVDIAGPLDSPVAAAADGVIEIAGTSTDAQGNAVGYGNYIVIAHAGRMITLYGHLDKLLVQPGQLVKAGDIIGLEGSSGNSTGPHLHFEVRVGGLLADPRSYLSGHPTAQ